MRLVTYIAGGARRGGAVVGDSVLDLASASHGRILGPVPSFLSDARLLQEARQLIERAATDEDFSARYCRPLSSLQLLSPVPRPGKVLCLGLNYRDHAAESGAPVPEEPIVFAKASSSVIGPAMPIRLPHCSQKVDYEVELAVIIGGRAKGISAAEAMQYVAGYTVLNDVTARDYQREKPGGQWTLAKSFDTFCPMGPWIVTADEIPDPHDLGLSTDLCGEAMQSSRTDQMIFGIPEIIEYITRVLTLEPGDVIGTGTPPGVGFARRPPRYLKQGDVVECRVEGIGTLRNPVH
ncbi:MAG: fumarylacetoacetate hydrolase family protein [Candidatus Brocadiia bacterium]